ncbi:MAG: hypothetical protein GX600_11905 [Dehalococcoidia bacterium]|nr:hypothetical protein [Dehalococcoidia bacterium]
MNQQTIQIILESLDKFTPVMDRFKQELKSAQGGVNDLSRAQEAAKASTNSFAASIGKLFIAYKSLRYFSGYLSQAVAEAVEAERATQALTAAMQQFGDSVPVKAVEDYLQTVAKLVGKDDDPYKQMIASMGTLTRIAPSAFAKMTLGMEGFARQTKKSVEEIGQHLVQMLNTGQDRGRMFGDLLKEGMTRDDILQAAQQFFDQYEQIARDAAGKVDVQLSRASAAWNNALESFGKGFLNSTTVNTVNIERLAQSMEKIGAGAGNVLKGVLTVIEAVSGVLAQVANMVTTTFTTAWDLLSGWWANVSEFISRIPERITLIWDVIVAEIKTKLGMIYDFISASWLGKKLGMEPGQFIDTEAMQSQLDTAKAALGKSLGEMQSLAANTAADIAKNFRTNFNTTKILANDTWSNIVALWKGQVTGLPTPEEQGEQKEALGTQTAGGSVEDEETRQKKVNDLRKEILEEEKRVVAGIVERYEQAAKKVKEHYDAIAAVVGRATTQGGRDKQERYTEQAARAEQKQLEAELKRKQAEAAGDQDKAGYYGQEEQRQKKAAERYRRIANPQKEAALDQSRKEQDDLAAQSEREQRFEKNWYAQQREEMPKGKAGPQEKDATKSIDKTAKSIDKAADKTAEKVDSLGDKVLDALKKLDTKIDSVSRKMAAFEPRTA